MVSLFRALSKDMAFAWQLAKSGQFRLLAAGLNNRAHMSGLKLMHLLEAAKRAGNRVEIDAKSDILGQHGRLQPKPSLTFPSGDAPLMASIVVPCFNYGAFVERAVRSALRQTLASVEIIVIDDGSDDPGTQAVLDDLTAWPRVTVVRQSNLGLPAARNAGITVARGEYICCLDADDTLEPTYLETAIAVLESDRATGFAYSWVRLFGDYDSIWRTRDFSWADARDDNHTSVSAIFRRDDWRAVKGYRSSMRHGYEDWEFWLRLAALGRKGRCIPLPLFNHRRHGATMTHSAHEKRKQIKAEIRRLNPQLFSFASALRPHLKAAQSPPAPFDVLGSAINRPDHASPPHMLVLMPSLGTGGSEILLRDVLEALKPNWRFSIMTTEPDPQPAVEAFRMITDEIVPLHGAFDADTWPKLLDHWIDTRGTSVVLSTNSLFAYDHVHHLKQRAAAAVKVADILHNDLPTGHLRRAVAAHHNIDLQFVVSQRIADAVLRSVGQTDKLCVVPNGVDVHSLFTPERADRQRCRRALGIAPDERVVAWVGGLRPEKRPLEFLATVKALSHRYRVRALLIGDGPLAPRVRGRIATLGLQETVVTKPHLQRNDLVDVYAAADATVMTSTVEGMPFVAIEAMATGCPVFSTDVGAVADLIAEGRNGGLVDKDRPEHLASLVEAFFDKDDQTRESWRAAAREAVIDGGYSLDTMTQTYRGALQALCSDVMLDRDRRGA